MDLDPSFSRIPRKEGRGGGGGLKERFGDFSKKIVGGLFR